MSSRDTYTVITASQEERYYLLPLNSVRDLRVPILLAQLPLGKLILVFETGGEGWGFGGSH